MQNPMDIFRIKMPKCRLCNWYMTPAEARAHSKHAAFIKWPK